MKNYIKILIAFFILLSINLFAWEVTTHETITKIAVTGKNRVENLNHFIDTFNLKKENYRNEGNVEFYYADGLSSDIRLGGSYIGIIQNIISDSRLQNQNLELDTKIQEGKYINLIQAGAILEDTQMKPSITSARFNRYFYDPSKSGCDGLANAECAKNWALDGGAANDNNDYSWKSVVGTSAQKGYFLESIIGDTNATRHTAQANLFVSLGFLSHLIEDMTQAAHVRGDMHAGAWKPGGANEFEIWANKNFNTSKKDPISYGLARNAPTFNPTSFDNLFTSTATWTNKNFFSDDTTPGDLTDTHNSPKNSTQQIEILTQYFGHNYYFLTANGLDIPDGTKLLYYIDRIGPKNLYTLVYAVPEDVKKLGYDKFSVLKDNAKFVFPRAVSAVEGMINYLFRAKIYAYVDPNDSDKLIIKNVTNQNEIAQGLDTAFRSDTKIYIYYETKNGERKKLFDKEYMELSDYKNQLVNGDTITIEGLSNAISNHKSEMNDDKTIIVALAGQMGGDGIGERAIAGAKLVFKNNASLLLSFDDSGSMGSKIEDTKQSALNLLPLFKDSNSSYIEVQAFNRSGISFTNDMNAVKNKINSLYSSGGTPLYKSMISAANSAIAEKNRHPNNKVIIVLYTDGIANNDNNKQNAIDAISKVKHPEIDEVYLVFVNTGDLSGKQILEDVATRADRHFIYLQSAEQLASELQKVLQ